jgi:hypothetical protein
MVIDIRLENEYSEALRKYACRRGSTAFSAVGLCEECERDIGTAEEEKAAGRGSSL